MAVDAFSAPAKIDAKTETLATLVQGLPNGKHVLKLTGNFDGVLAIRIHAPPVLK